MMSNQNPLLEGSKWKEKARKGELSQKSFDSLKNSDIGKKYLNPRNIIYNKRKGQKLELEKLKKEVPFKLYYDYSLKDPLRSRVEQNPIIGNPTIIHLANPKNERVKKLTTPLQRELIRQHETDEMIALLKMIKNGDYYTKLANKNEKLVDTKYSKKLLDKIESKSKDGKYNFPIIGKLKKVRDLKNYILGTIGYSHFPGVLNKEFETRNLLHPSNKKTTKSKVFKRGKYAVTNKHKRPDHEIEYGKQKPDKRILFNKVGIIPKIIKTIKSVTKK